MARFAAALTDGGDLDAAAWRGITWGIVAAFVQWQLRQGYAVATVNVRLSTVKTFCKLAMQAGALDGGEYARIRAIEGYRRQEAKHLDEIRETTRRGDKKAEPVSLTPDQARALKTQPDTPQGRRDAVLTCLLLDHGLRVGEVASLTVADLDLKAGELHFYRSKVGIEQTHRLTEDTLRSVRAYFEAGDAPAMGPLSRASRKDGKLLGAGMTERAITARVRTLGKAIGVKGLSAHDCRHFWATQAVSNGTPLDRLKDAGGWASLAMPMRYIEAARIANEGVRLGV
jgi:integrase